MQWEGIIFMGTTIFEKFINQYPVSKTLRFELIPQKNFTMDDFIKSQSFENDLKRAEAYPLVKKIIDGYHKWFIDDALKSLKIDWQPLKDAIADYRKDKNELTKKALDAVQKAKRKEIYDVFNKHKEFQYLFKKDLISEILTIWIKNANDADVEKKNKAVQIFNRFSTYFTGFHENRKNIYSEEAISTSVPYRIAHDNFPKFLGNMEAFEIIKRECPSVLKDAAKELQPIMEGIQIEDIFSLDFFNHSLTQKGIDFYNRIIGGVTPEKGQKLRGINEFINLYRQQHPAFAKNKKATKMVILFKQILSDRETLSFIPEMFVDDKQLQKSITTFYTQKILNFEIEGREVDVCEKLAHIVSRLPEDHSKIYIQQPELTNVSQKLFGAWGELNACLFNYAESKFESAKKASNKKKIDGWLKSAEFSFAELNTALQQAGKEQRIEHYFDDITALAQTIKTTYEDAKEILVRNYTAELRLREQAADVEKLKAFLDAVQELLHRLKPLCVSEETDKDKNFYNEFDVLYKQLKLIVPLYNEIRNYITQKLGEANKIKLKFDNPTLADGWDANKEEANTCVLLFKDSKYYLGVMNAKNKPKFASVKAASGAPCYQKMYYKQISDPLKDIPNLMVINEKTVRKTGRKDADGNNTVLEELKNKYLPSDINEIRKKGSYLKTSANFNEHDSQKYLKYYMDRIIEYKKDDIQFDFKNPTEYPSYSDFLADVARQKYRLVFVNIPESQINAWVDDRKLFLFQIYNKDFAVGTTGRPNLHTLYWKNLFTPENLKDVVFKLNGGAELFYRDSSIKKAVSHKVGEKMINRRDINGNPIPDAIHKELFLYHNKRSHAILSNEAKAYQDKVTVKEVTHEIIKDRRFTQPKFLFHVPITLNYKADVKNEYMNERVREFLANNQDVNIIGLDRGERNLIYLSLINQKGEILKQKSFNQIGGTDYQEKLVQREKERDAARKSWGTIGKIKELKEGYLSQVIHEIATTMVEHNSIVVLEDLNFGFKRGRFKVERQVYQKFEKMLIDKLNYLVFKEKTPSQPGSILKGYQLAEKFESFQKLGKQCGFLFYVPAAYTSKIDPTTGFVNLLNLNYTNMKDAQALFGNMDNIRYNPTSDFFEFALNYDNFKTPQKDFRKQWTVCTVGKKRFAYITSENGQKETKAIDVTYALKELFEKNDIEYASGKNIKMVLCQQTEAKFYERLLWLLKLTMQMRNSNVATNEDFIISPVKNNKNEFFISNSEPAGILPADADANGAYHIALKGLWCLEQIKKSDDLRKVKLAISNEEWLQFAQKKPFKK